MSHYFWTVLKDEKNIYSKDGSGWHSVEQPIDALILGNEKGLIALRCGKGVYHQSTEYIAPVVPGQTVEAITVKLRAQFQLAEECDIYPASIRYRFDVCGAHIVCLQDPPLPSCPFAPMEDWELRLRVGPESAGQWLTCEMVIGDESAKPKIYISPRKI